MRKRNENERNLKRQKGRGKGRGKRGGFRSNTIRRTQAIGCLSGKEIKKHRELEAKKKNK